MDRIGYNNSPGEWFVGYRGVGRYQRSNDVKDITGKIYKNSFIAGKEQYHKDCDDLFHPGKKVGIGVYCTPNADTAQGYSGESEINGIKYSTILMVIIKPNAIKHCSDSGDYWVVNGTTDEMRPY